MRKWQIIPGIIFCAALSFLSGQETELTLLFDEANRNMANEQYERAVRVYEQILGKGVEHPDLYYNLGNGYYRLGLYGQAIWAYEKGLQFAPRDEDLQYNLDLAKAHIRDRIEAPEPIFLLKWYRTFKHIGTLRDFLFWGSILLLLAGGIYAVIRMEILPIFGHRFITVSTVLIVMSVGLHGVALDKYWDLSGSKAAVVIRKEINAYSAPVERQDLIQFKIHEGLKVEVTQNDADWMEIILLDGKKGWIRSEFARLL